MRGPSYPYMGLKNLEQYLKETSWRPLSIEEQCYVNRIKQAILEQHRKLFAKLINPFNLCPLSLTFWFPVIPSFAIGVSVTNLRKVDIYIRQAMEPTFSNIFSAFLILELRVPSPLAILTLVSCIGLLLTGKVNKLLQATREQSITIQTERLEALNEKLNLLSSEPILDMEDKVLEALAEEKHRLVIESLNPFKLAPLSMSVFFPIYKEHTAIGIVFHDLDYLAVGLLQALEPNDKIFTIFRFIHQSIPFSLNLLVMFLAIGFFLTCEINQVEQGAREEIIQEVKGSIQ